MTKSHKKINDFFILELFLIIFDKFKLYPRFN